MKIIVEGIFGSKLYGTDNENSDSDYKGIFLPSFEDCVLDRISKTISANTNNSNSSKNTKDDIDRMFFSLQYFGILCARGDMVAFDLLHTPDNKITFCDEIIWTKIRNMRSKFYSKDIRGYLGYIGKQVNKYGFKGSRVNQLQKSIEILKKLDPIDRVSSAWNELLSIENVRELKCEENQSRTTVLISGKKFMQTTPVRIALECLEKEFGMIGTRALQAHENNNVDWKAVSHAYRVLFQLEELLDCGDITFPLKSADYLKAIKFGKLPYDKVSGELEEFTDRIFEKLDNSNLPKEVDLTFWNDFVVGVYSDKTFS